jgi:hypothetical protein
VIKLNIILMLNIKFFKKSAFNTLKLVYGYFFLCVTRNRNCLFYLVDTQQRLVAPNRPCGRTSHTLHTKSFNIVNLGWLYLFNEFVYIMYKPPIHAMIFVTKSQTKIPLPWTILDTFYTTFNMGKTQINPRTMS